MQKPDMVYWLKCKNLQSDRATANSGQAPREHKLNQYYLYQINHFPVKKNSLEPITLLPVFFDKIVQEITAGSLLTRSYKHSVEKGLSKNFRYRNCFCIIAPA